MEEKKSLDLHTELPAQITWSPPRTMQQQHTGSASGCHGLYGKGLLSKGIFYRSARSRCETEGQIDSGFLSTTWQKNSTWQQGTAEHLPLGEDQGVSIRTVHRNWVSCTTHCPVFPWKHVPGQQLLCQPGFLPSAKCKRVGLTAAGKGETTLSNQPHASPQGFREWMQLGQAPVHTFWMASK